MVSLRTSYYCQVFILPRQRVVHVKVEHGDGATDVGQGDDLQLVLNPSCACVLSWDEEHSQLRLRLKDSPSSRLPVNFTASNCPPTAPPALPYWRPLSVRVTCTAGFSPKVETASTSTAATKRSIVLPSLQCTHTSLHGSLTRFRSIGDQMGRKLAVKPEVEPRGEVSEQSSPCFLL